MRVLEIQSGGSLRQIVTYLTDEEITDLAGIPPEGVIGVMAADGSLQVNSIFREFLHSVIAHAAPRDPDMRDVARVHGDGRLVYIDSRVPETVHPVPDEDILGWFQVQNGIIVPGSYLPNPHHRIQAAHGLSAAIAGMHAAMVNELRSR